MLANSIMHVYSHHSSKNHLEVVLSLIKNAKLNDESYIEFEGDDFLCIIL